MSAKKGIEPKKKLNVPALISILLVFLVIPLLLIPWHRLFVLRSNTLSTMLIHVIGLAVIGLIMLVIAVTALVLSRKHKGLFKGNWLAWLGVGFGAILLGIGFFFVIDYLQFINR